MRSSSTRVGDRLRAGRSTRASTDRPRPTRACGEVEQVGDQALRALASSRDAAERAQLRSRPARRVPSSVRAHLDRRQRVAQVVADDADHLLGEQRAVLGLARCRSSSACDCVSACCASCCCASSSSARWRASSSSLLVLVAVLGDEERELVRTTAPPCCAAHGVQHHRHACGRRDARRRASPRPPSPASAAAAPSGSGGRCGRPSSAGPGSLRWPTSSLARRGRSSGRTSRLTRADRAVGVGQQQAAGGVLEQRLGVRQHGRRRAPSAQRSSGAGTRRSRRRWRRARSGAGSGRRSR